MNAEELWETTMNPRNRVLLQVKIDDAQEADQVFDMLMGDQVPPRKKFIQTCAKTVKNLDVWYLLEIGNFDISINVWYYGFKEPARAVFRTENMNIINWIIKFLKEVRLETKKVNWLTRQELLNYTLVVVGFMLAMALFFGAIDYGFSLLLQKFVLTQ